MKFPGSIACDSLLILNNVTTGDGDYEVEEVH